MLSRLHVASARLVRIAVIVSMALTGALGLTVLVDSPRPVEAAQTCTTFSTLQVYCLTKTDATDPIRVNETQLFTIVESLTAGSAQITSPGALTDVVPANYRITGVAATSVGSASGPPCTLTGNTVVCPGPRTLGPGAGQLIVTITAIATTPTSNSKCDSVNNTATSSQPGLISNTVSEPTTILREKGPAACGRKSNLDQDDDDKEKKETKEEKQDRRRTDNSNRDQIKTEGNVVGVRCKQSDDVPTVKKGYIAEPDQTPYILIGNSDGVQQLTLIRKAKSDCKDVQVGDYVKADGEKENEQLFQADEIEIRRDGKKVN
jgi:hypothetical protein